MRKRPTSPPPRWDSLDQFLSFSKDGLLWQLSAVQASHPVHVISSRLAGPHVETHFYFPRLTG